MRKSHLEHPLGIENGEDFLERIAYQFALDYLDAIEDTNDPEIAAQFAEAAAACCPPDSARQGRHPAQRGAG
jgi:hypothetical protein